MKSPLISIRRHDAAIIAGMLKPYAQGILDAPVTGDLLIDEILSDEAGQAIELRKMLLAAIKVADGVNGEGVV